MPLQRQNRSVSRSLQDLPSLLFSNMAEAAGDMSLSESAKLLNSNGFQRPAPLANDEILLRSYPNSPKLMAISKVGKNAEFSAAAENLNVQIREGSETDLCAYLADVINVTKLINMQIGGETALHTAVRVCKPLVVQKLLQLGAKVNKVSEAEGFGPFHICAKITQADNSRLTAVFLALLNGGGRINLRSKNGSTPLHLATKEGNLAFVTVLLEQIQTVAEASETLLAQDGVGQSFIHIAARYDQLDIVDSVLSWMNVNSPQLVSFLLALKSQNGYTATHYASQYGNLDLLQILLSHHANPNIPNAKGETSLHCACLSDKPDVKIVSLLISFGATVGAKTFKGSNVVHLACRQLNCGADLIDILLRKSGKIDVINVRNSAGMTPLLMATMVKHTDAIVQLLNHDANLLITSNKGDSVLHYCAGNNNAKGAKLILESFSDPPTLVKLSNRNGSTALHIASLMGHTEVATVLISQGADPCAMDRWHQTPLQLATSKKHSDLVEMYLNTLFGGDETLDNMAKAIRLACQMGCTDYVRMRLDDKREIDGHQVNKFLLQPTHEPNLLELAITNGHKAIAQAFVQSDLWKLSLRSYSGSECHPVTPMRMLIAKFPDVALIVFDRCIELKRSNALQFRYEFIEDTYNLRYDTTFSDNTSERNKFLWGDRPYDMIEDSIGAKPQLNPYTTNVNWLKDNHPLMLMVKLGREDLLNHPLVRTLVQQKWKWYGRYWYFLLLLFYANFVFFLTGYFLVTPAPLYSLNQTIWDSESRCVYGDEVNNTQIPISSHFSTVAKYVIFVQSPISLLKEMFELNRRRRRYFTGENLIEISLYSMSFVLMLDFHDCSTLTGTRELWQWVVGTVALFLTWINLALFLRKFQQIGIQIIIFTQVLRTFIKYLYVCIIFLIAFALVFYALLQNTPQFHHPIMALLKLAVMVVDEFDTFDRLLGIADSTAKPQVAQLYYSFATIFFLLFLCLISIIIMNMLVGLAVVNIKDVLEKAKLAKLAMRAEMVTDIETNLQNFRFIRQFLSRKGFLAPKQIIQLDGVRRRLQCCPKRLRSWLLSRLKPTEDEILLKAKLIAEAQLKDPLLNSKKERNLEYCIQTQEESLLKLSNLDQKFDDSTTYFDKLMKSQERNFGKLSLLDIRQQSQIQTFTEFSDICVPQLNSCESLTTTSVNKLALVEAKLEEITEKSNCQGDLISMIFNRTKAIEEVQLQLITQHVQSLLDLQKQFHLRESGQLERCQFAVETLLTTFKTQSEENRTMAAAIAKVNQKTWKLTEAKVRQLETLQAAVINRLTTASNEEDHHSQAAPGEKEKRKSKKCRFKVKSVRNSRLKTQLFR